MIESTIVALSLIGPFFLTCQYVSSYLNSKSCRPKDTITDLFYGLVILIHGVFTGFCLGLAMQALIPLYYACGLCGRPFKREEFYRMIFACYLQLLGIGFVYNDLDNVNVSLVGKLFFLIGTIVGIINFIALYGR